MQNKNKRVVEQKWKQPENFSEASVALDNYSDGDLLGASNGDSKPFEDWILDLGWMFHMYPNMDCFSTYETVPTCAMMMGNNASCRIVGIRTI